jgi:hypothetical protein
MGTILKCGLVAISHQLLVLLHLAALVACGCSGLYRDLFCKHRKTLYI